MGMKYFIESCKKLENQYALIDTPHTICWCFTFSDFSLTKKTIKDAGIKANPMVKISEDKNPSAVFSNYWILQVFGHGWLITSIESEGLLECFLIIAWLTAFKNTGALSYTKEFNKRVY